MPDIEAAEFTSSGAGVASLVANEIEKVVSNFAEEGVGFMWLAFDDELNAAVGHVADVAGYLAAAGN
jgi:hypothetical protein